MNIPWHAPTPYTTSTHYFKTPLQAAGVSHCAAVSSTVNDRAAHIKSNWECRKEEERSPPLPGSVTSCACQLGGIYTVCSSISYVPDSSGIFHWAPQIFVTCLVPPHPPCQTFAHFYFPLLISSPTCGSCCYRCHSIVWTLTDFSRQNASPTWVWREFSQLN